MIILLYLFILIPIVAGFRFISLSTLCDVQRPAAPEASPALAATAASATKLPWPQSPLSYTISHDF